MRAVISPHLDDGVLSCGDLLAVCPGTLLVTVFAGTPTDETLTSWDAASGFAEGDDVMAARRQEDAAACVLLGAQPCWLPYRDAQYGEPAERNDVAAYLESLGWQSVGTPMAQLLADNGLTTIPQTNDSMSMADTVYYTSVLSKR